MINKKLFLLLIVMFSMVDGNLSASQTDTVLPVQPQQFLPANNDPRVISLCLLCCAAIGAMGYEMQKEFNEFKKKNPEEPIFSKKRLKLGLKNFAYASGMLLYVGYIVLSKQLIGWADMLFHKAMQNEANRLIS